MTRHEISHSYLLQKYKVAFKYKETKSKSFKILTLIMFTNTLNYSLIQTL